MGARTGVSHTGFLGARYCPWTMAYWAWNQVIGPLEGLQLGLKSAVLLPGAKVGIAGSLGLGPGHRTASDLQSGLRLEILLTGA